METEVVETKKKRRKRGRSVMRVMGGPSSLTLLHAMQRITKTLKTAPGASAYFLARYEACAIGERYSFISVSTFRHREMALLSASLHKEHIDVQV